ncbi:MAG: DUF4214 domain-containing protein [Pyrinomonadaceae bacterium]
MRKLILSFAAAAVLSAAATVAQGQSAPTLRIVTEDPTLPSELFYGNTKVKPLRLRPGTNQVITINDSDFFVQQQYIDFLSRFPETEGFNAWMNELAECNGDRACLDGPDGKRVLVSQSFFLSPEFNIKGFYAFRFYRVSFGQVLPEYAEIVADMRSLTGVTSEDTAARREAFMNAWVQRANFRAAYPDTMSAQAYVDKLEQTAGVAVANKATLVTALTNGSMTRAQVLRDIVDSSAVQNKELNPGFVAMQYYGYLRRKPEADGYNDWLNYLNAHPGDYKTMVWGFVYSQEYHLRF